MLDHSFTEAKPPDKLHVVTQPSTTQRLVGFDQKPSFSSIVQPVKKPWSRSWQDTTGPVQQPDVSSWLKPLAFYAEPLAPLRQRDEQALEDVFDDQQIDDILADVCMRLRQLYPEPCWEDGPFDFLQGYI